MNQTIHGTCSICGGAVTTPTVFWSVIPPVPTCQSCGAVKAPYGPVIPMQPAPHTRVSTGTSCEDLVELLRQGNETAAPPPLRVEITGEVGVADFNFDKWQPFNRANLSMRHTA